MSWVYLQESSAVAPVPETKVNEHEHVKQSYTKNKHVG